MKRPSPVNISLSTTRAPRVVDIQLLTSRQGAKRRRNSHLFEREEHDHYVEPHWLSRRLFEVESFDRNKLMFDRCTGWGRIADAAKAAGYRVATADIVDRGYAGCTVQDFLTRKSLPPSCSVVCNPPFGLVERFICHALNLGARKVAVVYPIPRINAAWDWLHGLPLQRVWLITPRPSMPPGYVIAAGEKPGKGREDFAWLVFVRGYRGEPVLRWVHRDGPISEQEPKRKR